MYFKDFDTWNIVKKRIQREDRNVFIRAGEVRWVSIGVNVGSEIDGKGVSFTRPALILNVSGSHIAFIIPMSTKMKDVAGYVPFRFQLKEVALCIHQTKVVSQKRIFGRLGKISDKNLQVCKDQVKQFFSL